MSIIDREYAFLFRLRPGEIYPKPYLTDEEREAIRDEIYFDTYTCFMCHKPYTVNEPGTWRLCTPDYCHDCYELEAAA